MTRRTIIPILLLTLPIPGGLAQPPKPELVASTDPRSPEEERKAFRLPPGFEAHLVAAEPDIAKPMNIAFDAKGRLWLTDTLEYPFPAEKGSKPRDTVKVLEDFGPDGRARKVTTFADELNIPIGLLPLGDSALVFGIPAIYRHTDTDGNGKADTRELLYGKFGSIDTHGMTNSFTLGFDGWVYACHGFRNDSTVKGKDGSTVTMNSGNVYRFRLDGSRVEQMTWGQVNPFGLSLDPLGNLYSADCHSMPIYQLLRGAYYPSFGKPHDGLGFGPTMMKHQHASTGIAGVTYYAADHFPKVYHGSIFVGNVVTSRINHDRIAWTGSTPQAVEQEDFLVSDDPWFRPVDIKLGPDGALYVADFYNRIIGHYEVDLKHPGRDRHRGRIWRIVYRGPDGKGKAVAPRTDFTMATTAELVGDLAHPNLRVRLFATHELAARKNAETVKAVRPLMRRDSDPTQRAHALWVLERMGMLEPSGARAGVLDTEALVRVHACRVLSERESLTEPERTALLDRLRDRDANVQRAAADALGRHADARHIRPLLEALRRVPAGDTHLRHVVRMAVRNQMRDAKTWPLPIGGLTDRDEAALADMALGIPRREAAAYLLAHVGKGRVNHADLVGMAGHIARHGTDADTLAILNLLENREDLSAGQEGTVFRAVEQGTAQRGAQLAEGAQRYGTRLAGRLMDSDNAVEVQLGITLAGSLKWFERQDRLRQLLADPDTTEGQQLAAIDALAAIDLARHADLLGRLLTQPKTATKVRQQCATVLARDVQGPSAASLIRALQVAPAPVQTIIAEALAGSPAGAKGLLRAVEEGKASARLLQERGVQARLLFSRVAGAKERIEKLTAGLPAANVRIAALIRSRREAFSAARTDPEAGRVVFEKHCANCHQIAGKGAKIGPQLDGIGIRGTDRLLEDSLDPGRNVDQAFRTTMLVLKKGQVVSGLFLREEGAVLVLADNQGTEVRVPRDDVQERSTSPVSPMPGNLNDLIGEQEFYNLLAYLLLQRVAEK